MSFILSLIGLIAPYFLVKYRDKIIEITGKFGWAEKYLGQGGSYTAVVLFAIFLFLFSLLYITGNEGILFSWITPYVAH